MRPKLSIPTTTTKCWCDDDKTLPLASRIEVITEQNIEATSLSLSIDPSPYRRTTVIMEIDPLSQSQQTGHVCRRQQNGATILTDECSHDKTNA